MKSINEIRTLIANNRTEVEAYVAEHTSYPLVKRFVSEMPDVVLEQYYVEVLAKDLTREEVDVLDKETIDYILEIAEDIDISCDICEYMVRLYY